MDYVVKLEGGILDGYITIDPEDGEHSQGIVRTFQDNPGRLSWLQSRGDKGIIISVEEESEDE